jgi:hypothetical protein
MQKIVGQDDEAARNLSVRLARKLFTEVRGRGILRSSYIGFCITLPVSGRRAAFSPARLFE